MVQVHRRVNSNGGGSFVAAAAAEDGFSAASSQWFNYPTLAWYDDVSRQPPTLQVHRAIKPTINV
jgi:hypothetical protein